MKDYIIIKSQDNIAWYEILTFDHFLTDGEVERIQKIINKAKREIEDYCIDDIEDLISKEIPFTQIITVSDTDNYHTLYY